MPGKLRRKRNKLETDLCRLGLIRYTVAALQSKYRGLSEAGAALQLIDNPAKIKLKKVKANAAASTAASKAKQILDEQEKEVK